MKRGEEPFSDIHDRPGLGSEQTRQQKVGAITQTLRQTGRSEGVRREGKSVSFQREDPALALEATHQEEMLHCAHWG